MTPSIVTPVLLHPGLNTLGRCVLTCPFWIAGLRKPMDWPSALAEMAHFGLAPAVPLAILVVALQLGGSLAVILDRWTWFAAGALAAFTFVATLIAHPFWAFPEDQRFAQANIFFEHMALIGGLLLAAILAETAKDRRSR